MQTPEQPIKPIGIGERIKLIRQLRGYSQSQAAELLGISQQAYAEKEKQGADPRCSSLLELCKVLNVEPSFMLNDGIEISARSLQIYDGLELGNQAVIQELTQLREKIQKMKIIISEQRVMIDQLSE